ncbi:MAG: flagellar biosynthesis protein FlhB [Gammaproteobacteria bacterium]|nr:flagellar biosynthesis protein FlhB [Gammaproteobacteria bacterium]
MAEDSGQERSEEPTDKRVRESREKGQIARSRELTTLTMLLIASAGFLIFGAQIVDGITGIMHDGFVLERGALFDSHRLFDALMAAVVKALLLLAPLCALLVVGALVAPMALGGWSFSIKSVSFQWSKVDPIKGLKRVFGWRGLMELLKALAKFLLILSLAIWLLWDLKDSFIALGQQEPAQALVHAGELLSWCFVALSSVLIVVAAIDVPFQIWEHKRQLKMTRQEIKDEMKDTDGNPELKRRIRSAQQEMAQKRMMQEIPKADVIVTNPDHYAVALRYAPADVRDASHAPSRAPMVVAKGVDVIAMQIRALASEHEIPLLAAPPLARALYYSTELNHEIPMGLYRAVAQVLAYVYQLRRTRRYYSEKPIPMRETLPIPDELRR